MEGGMTKMDNALSPKTDLRVWPPTTSTSNNGVLPSAQSRSTSLRNAVRQAFVHLLVLDKSLVGQAGCEFLDGQEVVVVAVSFPAQGAQVVALALNPKANSGLDAGCTTVVLPAPEGAEKMMARPSPCGLPCGHGSEHIQDLLLDFLELVFHLDHDALEFGVVRLAAQGVDFTPHLGRQTRALPWADPVFMMSRK